MVMKILSTLQKLFLVELDLQSNFSILQEWFYEYHIILNHGKCHYMPLVGHTKIE